MLAVNRLAGSPNPEHFKRLKKNIANWNTWRKANIQVIPQLARVDLRKALLQGADLFQAYLRRADLRGADLRGADLRGADLYEANLRKADLSGSYLSRANLRGAALDGANLTRAALVRADLARRTSATTSLRKSNLSGANLREAILDGANMTQANLSGANLQGAHLHNTNLRDADLRNANLSQASLVGTMLRDAKLTGCCVHGVSAWNVDLAGAEQSSLVITPYNEPEITVDRIEVAQFVYLMLNNKRLREVIDTLTSKLVLILGRFTPERKRVLDSLREELRKRNYVPVLFDFEKPRTLDYTETITLLARMARFIIADLTDPSSIPQELQAIVPDIAVPVQPILQGDRPYSMFPDFTKYSWVLRVHRYTSANDLIAGLGKKVIRVAEAKVRSLARSKR